MAVIIVSSLTVSTLFKILQHFLHVRPACDTPVTLQPPRFYSPKILGGQYNHEGCDTITNKMHNTAIESFATETLKLRHLSILQ
jgi:hypothetical protein